MNDSLIDRLFDEEFNIRDARRFLEYVSGQQVGKRRFNFNVFDVVLDLEASTATVEDILAPDSTDTVSLSAFVSRIRRFVDASQQ